MRLASAAVVSVLLVLSLIGQTTTNSTPQKTLTKAEIEKLVASAEAKLEKLSYRKKSAHIYFGDDEKSPYSASTTTTEVVLHPDRMRIVSESKDNQGIVRTEQIYVGSRIYYKKGDDPWRIEKYPFVNAADSDVFQQKSYPEAIYKYDYLYLGEENLSGIVTDVYQASIKEVFRSQEFDIVNLRIGKFWFDKKKRLLKKQFNSTDGTLQFDPSKKLPKEFEQLGQKSTRSEQEIVEYEYDIPIKIEAPIK